MLIGGSDIFPSAHRASIPGLQAIYQRRAGTRTEFLLQALASASTIGAAGSNLSALSEPEYQFTIGLRRLARDAIYAVAFAENVSNFDNSSDVSPHFSATWRWD